MVKDHLGNEFTSIEAMCKHYGISTKVYYYRVRSGWTKEMALTGCITNPVNKSYSNQGAKVGKVPEYIVARVKINSNKAYYDHLGNKFDSIDSMCEHWGISKSVYAARLRSGWDAAKALTVPVRTKAVRTTSKLVWIDHIGNKFSSFEDMCYQYGKEPQLVINRLSYGLSLGDALMR